MYYVPFPTTLAGSASRGAGSGSSDLKDVSEFIEGQLFVDVTGVTGTNPTLDLTVEVSPDEGVTWFTHTTLTQITGVGKVLKLLTNLGRRMRVSWAVGGTNTPTVTFSVAFAGKGHNR